MTDIEHAKEYAKESISLAISMYNPTDKYLEIADRYGKIFTGLDEALKAKESE